MRDGANLHENLQLCFFIGGVFFVSSFFNFKNNYEDSNLYCLTIKHIAIKFDCFYRYF